MTVSYLSCMSGQQLLLLVSQLHVVPPPNSECICYQVRESLQSIIKYQLNIDVILGALMSLVNGKLQKVTEHWPSITSLKKKYSLTKNTMNGKQSGDRDVHITLNNLSLRFHFLLTVDNNYLCKWQLKKNWNGPHCTIVIIISSRDVFRA